MEKEMVWACDSWNLIPVLKGYSVLRKALKKATIPLKKVRKVIIRFSVLLLKLVNVYTTGSDLAVHIQQMELQNSAKNALIVFQKVSGKFLSELTALFLMVHFQTFWRAEALCTLLK